MSFSADKTLTVHERCGVLPPNIGEGNVVSLSLPITLFDVPWLRFHPIQRLLFYKFPCSTAHFLEFVVPNLKSSLSQTLFHYLPLVGKLIFPPDYGMPEFRCVHGNSVSLTVAEANESFDFNHLTSRGPQEAHEFHSFVPSLPDPEVDSESGIEKVSLLALQVTLFPEVGICLGFTNHHAIGDASSIVKFIRAWSTVSKFGGNEGHGLLTKNGLIPISDRSLIEDQSGRRERLWNRLRLHKPEFRTNLSTEKVRGTFVLTNDDILKLKNLVLAKETGQVHLSSFTVTAAYVWTCFVKCDSEEKDDNEPEYFGIPMDARNRLDPPVPAGYFGNCLSFGVAEATKGQLKGDGGFVLAAKVIGNAISDLANKRGGVLWFFDNLEEKIKPLIGKRIFGVSGSPRFDLYEADFGWGMAKKYEVVSIDLDLSMSLCKSKESRGGLEVGLSLSKNQFEAFADIFTDGLNI